MKKIFIWSIVLIIILLLTSCGKETVVTINSEKENTSIKNELEQYYTKFWKDGYQKFLALNDWIITAINNLWDQIYLNINWDKLIDFNISWVELGIFWETIDGLGIIKFDDNWVMKFNYVKSNWTLLFWEKNDTSTWSYGDSNMKNIITFYEDPEDDFYLYNIIKKDWTLLFEKNFYLRKLHWNLYFILDRKSNELYIYDINKEIIVDNLYFHDLSILLNDHSLFYWNDLIWVKWIDKNLLVKDILSKNMLDSYWIHRNSLCNFNKINKSIFWSKNNQNWDNDLNKNVIDTSNFNKICINWRKWANLFNLETSKFLYWTPKDKYVEYNEDYDLFFVTDDWTIPNKYKKNKYNIIQTTWSFDMLFSEWSWVICLDKWYDWRDVIFNAINKSDYSVGSEVFDFNTYEKIYDCAYNSHTSTCEINNTTIKNHPRCFNNINL